MLVETWGTISKKRGDAYELILMVFLLVIALATLTNKG
jgi:hypothetical protein